MPSICLHFAPMNTFASTPYPISRMIAIGLVAASAAVAGCASAPPEQALPQAPVTTSGSARPDGSVRGDTEDARIAQLWSAAQEAYSKDDEVAALERLYEALEIDPGNGLLWSRAAEIQLDAEEPVQAENFAIKSNNFAGANNALLYRNWLIVEHARRMRGDLLGVRSAHRKVQQFQYR